MTMPGLVESLPWLLGSLGLVIALSLLKRPLSGLLRLLGVGQFFGAGLGINLINALTLGVLGVPGFGLLLMLRWVLR